MIKKSLGRLTPLAAVFGLAAGILMISDGVQASEIVQANYYNNPSYGRHYYGGYYDYRHPVRPLYRPYVRGYRGDFPGDRDDNPPGPRGGPGTNWENPPGPRGGPGASPNRRYWR